MKSYNLLQQIDRVVYSNIEYPEQLTWYSKIQIRDWSEKHRQTIIACQRRLSSFQTQNVEYISPRNGVRESLWWNQKRSNPWRRPTIQRYVQLTLRLTLGSSRLRRFVLWCVMMKTTVITTTTTTTPDSVNSTTIYRTTIALSPDAQVNKVNQLVDGINNPHVISNI